MKKTYEKPFVHIESFELSQFIASCEFNVRGQDTAEKCYAVGTNPDFGSVQVKVFMDTSKCDVIAEEYCYGNMTGATPVFSSF